MEYPLALAYGPLLAMTAFAAMLLSASATGIALLYARHKGLIDAPGQRRSHTEPTPRGGGVGILIIAIMGLWAVWPLPWEHLLVLSLSVAGIGLIGWIDDHRGLTVLSRLLLQALAALVAVVVLAGFEASIIFGCLAALGVMGLTNVMNFMDGSNGLATLEGIFLAAMGTFLAGVSGHFDWALWCLLLACACAGFLPFNVPKAKIFLGDVGSTSLGFCLAVAGVALIVHGALSIWQALLLLSAFLADAGYTLAWRILCGRRWYTAHREHTYQWLIRTGFSHLEVAAAYMAYNLLLVSPLILLGMRHPDWQPALTLGTYGLVLVAWVGARVWCLGRARTRAV